MSKSTRGWTGADRAKPAEEVDIRYGHGLLKQESSRVAGLRPGIDSERAPGRWALPGP